MRYFSILGAAAGVALLLAGSAHGQVKRVLGVDISYWNNGTSSTGTSQANWNTAFNTPDGNGNTRQFAWIRASRGGATGVDQPQGTPGGGSTSTLSRRYDDPRFVQNITRATASGMLAGAYHFGRPDVAGNTGTDEANHFIEAAGAWMRPGYMMPVFDLEAGSANGGSSLAQFSLDFSNRLYAAMGIRPAIYVNGNYSSILQGASSTLRNQLAQPVANSPSVVGPAFPMLWDARYGMGSVGQTDPSYNINNIPIQTGSPQNNGSFNSTYYGPWDDYGNSQPWSFWQFSSVASVPGFNEVDSGIDSNVSHGDIQYVRNYLVPAVWKNDSSGDWGTLANWNSGQAAVAPVQAPGQATPYMTGNLPTPRLPGAAGSGPTSGQYDTVILERPSANITVTVSAGSHDVRKLYMREALNITGGSLTINYDPTYRPDNDANVLHGGPLSAQFSGAVTLSGGSLSVHTLQVDATRTFTVGGGDLTFNKINLMPHASTSAKILMNGDLNVSPLADATATIANGAGSGASGRVDLDGANREFNVANGAAEVDLSISVPVTNGGLTKAGAGTLALSGLNTYAGDTAVEAGALRLTGANLANAADMYLTTGSLLDLTFAAGAPDVIDSLFFDGVSQQAGVWGAVGSGAQFTSSLITGTGTLQVTTFVAPVPGDFDGNGTVEAADLTAWQNGYGMPNGANASNGDGDDDGDVDGNDFLVWQRNLGMTQSTATSTANAAAVPEPTAAALMLVAMGGLMGRRWLGR